MAKILCIDDESAALNIRKRVLETADHQVLTARSGEEGIRLFRSEPFDLVLLDYWMPGMNGIATARELESFSRYPVLATAPHDIRVAKKPWSGFKKQGVSRSERDPASPRNMIPAIQKLGGIHET